MGNSYRKESVQVSKRLKLAKISEMFTNEETSKVEVTLPCNHVFCIDVSGSMYDSLPKMRTQLKSKLVDIVNEKDTVSLIWFDDKCGYISELAHINSVQDVREMNRKIDEFLRPGGCTNFYDPIELTNKLISRVDNLLGYWNFIFLSDGGHNTGGSWEKVISELSKLQENISSATIIEYGYYADSSRLSQMAETLGGSKIFNEDFENYEVQIPKAFGGKTVKRVEFDITDFKSSMKRQIIFSYDTKSESVKVYSTAGVNSILIPEDTKELYYIEESKGTPVEVTGDYLKSLYAAVYVFADRLSYDIVEELLYATKDKEAIDMYCNSYGKQRLAAFNDHILSKANPFMNQGITKIDKEYKPNPKAYCILDLIDDLMESSDNKIHIYHSEFNYTRTGAKSVVKRILTEEDRKKLIEADTKLKVSKVLDEIDSNSVKMRIKNPNEGYSIRNLVWNSERANLSFQVKVEVILTLPNGSEIESFIIRNYTFIKDGILNVSSLPMELSKETKKKLKLKKKLKITDLEDGICKIDFSDLPIINKKRTESVFMTQMADWEVDLLRNKMYKRYISYLMKLAPRDSSVSSTWDPKLTELGITPGGYSPKTELDKSGDFYMAPTLESKIEKFSSIPQVTKVLEKISLGKSLTTSESYMSDVMNVVNSILGKDNPSYDELNDLFSNYDKESKELIEKIAKSKFSLILSRKWFKDRTGGYDDNSMKVRFFNEDLTIKFEFRDKKVDL